MKSRSISHIAAAAGSAMLLALLAVCPAFAANPLNQPRGLALDSKGNLYVANQGNNKIIVFNPNYVEVKAISTGLDMPSGVAFDTLGNIYVSNLGNGEVTIYSSTGAQNSAATITGLNSPQGIAVDGIGNIFVDEAYQDVRVYAANFSPSSNVPIFVKTYTPAALAFSIATHNQYLAWGSLSYSQTLPIDSIFAGGGYPTNSASNEALAVGFDGVGNLYMCNSDNSVYYSNFSTELTSVFLTLGFSCEGVVVDAARQRVYLSNQQGNSIAVYNTSGTLLKTIE